MKLNWINQVKHGIGKKAPVICASLALIGVFGAVATAIHDTPKAIQLREEEAIRREEEGLEPLTRFEAVKISLPAYIPTIATTAATSVCLIASVVSGEKKYAVLAAASSLAETSFRNFRESAQEVLTPEDFKKVTERAADKTIERVVQNGAVANDDIVVTGHGNILCIESWSGKTFRSSKEWVEHCMNIMNQRMINETWVTLADFLSEIGVYNYGKSCEYIGWEINRNGMIEPAMDSKLIDGEPALVINYVSTPQVLPELM